MDEDGDGAEVKESPTKCPFCNCDPRGENCLDDIDLNICPTDKPCKSKEGDKRAGCQGYSSGSKGYSGCLSDNILANIPKHLAYDRFKAGDFDRIGDDGKKKERDGTVKFSKAIKASFENIEFTDDFVTDDNFQKLLDAAKEQDLELKKSNNNYRQFHPLFENYGGSIEAHHLICTATMKDSEEWANVCKITGYNLNCRWNGVFLPSLMSVACTARIPLHRGGHGAGFGGKDKSGKHTTYAIIMRKEVNKILTQARDKREECPDKKKMKEIAKGIVDSLNELSEKAFNKVKDFVWTLTADGFDYMPGNPIGCGDYTDLKNKTDALGNDDNHINLHNDIKKISIADIERKRTQTLKRFDDLLKNKNFEGFKICTHGEGGRKHENVTQQYTLKIGE